jgi:hypothetical protein
LSENRRARKIEEKKTVLNEDDILPKEKWVVRFIDRRSRKTLQESTFVRQFRAPGFYEAYDMVMTYAEKSNLDILWFKEKRRCGDDYANRNFRELESYCTYCNKKFDHLDPLPCTNGNCSAEFCSKECALNHHFMRHLRHY